MALEQTAGAVEASSVESVEPDELDKAFSLIVELAKAAGQATRRPNWD